MYVVAAMGVVMVIDCISLKENGLERNTCQKKLLENSIQANYVEGLLAYQKGNTNYKDTLNAATTEIRQYKRDYEQKLACNVKNYSKSFYVYVRIKTKCMKQCWTFRRQCWKYNITRFFNGIRPKWILQFSVYQK